MQDVEELEEQLSRPSDALIDDFGRLEGDIVVLGANGKMGPTLVRMAARAVAASGSRGEVIAVSRFGSPGSAEALERFGVTAIAADITDDSKLTAIPDVENVVYLVGAKFGTTGQEHVTWATNTYLPGRVAERFAASRIAALSTGNVYPFSTVDDGIPTEEAEPSPLGDYAMSCLGRERIFTHFSHRNGTPVSLIRLNYAVDLRYGVLVDVARSVLEGTKIDLRMGYANVIWQRYANEVVLRSLLHADSPPFVLNLTGGDIVSIRHVANRFGEMFGKVPSFEGTEAPTALLADASLCHRLFGPPTVNSMDLVEMVGEWVGQGRPTLDKPTRFQSRDGKF